MSDMPMRNPLSGPSLPVPAPPETPGRCPDAAFSGKTAPGLRIDLADLAAAALEDRLSPSARAPARPLAAAPLRPAGSAATPPLFSPPPPLFGAGLARPCPPPRPIPRPGPCLETPLRLLAMEENLTCQQVLRKFCARFNVILAFAGQTTALAVPMAAFRPDLVLLSLPASAGAAGIFADTLARLRRETTIQPLIAAMAEPHRRQELPPGLLARLDGWLDKPLRRSGFAALLSLCGHHQPGPGSGDVTPGVFENGQESRAKAFGFQRPHALHALQL
ncbi:hypothetical protein [Pseudogemmobacter faecipullorum]|uniref:Response regulatory domain-containing protein n=1 Tax=Pseudogemmobacter faecipullorum TaxID=2755041 RepID=A0ABS8CNU3_9RHOB|nr:hypothetical protein [Pseudogemmobacter faecipullorum]MCB5411038.1 hypothetical protein [Pseudogemmobacter faecipullorum]